MYHAYFQSSWKTSGFVESIQFWLKIIEIQRKYKILQATSNQYMAPLAASI